MILYWWLLWYEVDFHGHFNIYNFRDIDYDLYLFLYYWPFGFVFPRFSLYLTVIGIERILQTIILDVLFLVKFVDFGFLVIILKVQIYLLFDVEHVERRGKRVIDVTFE